MANNRKILFVDGETQSLRELHDAFIARPQPWETLYCSGGLAALELLQQSPCEAVVTDLRLADVSGDQLLDQVGKQYPQTHRVMLADLGDLQALLHCVGNVNQFLILPCEVERLQIVLERAVTFDLWQPNQTVRELLGRLPQLPSPSDHYAKVVRELQTPGNSPDVVGGLIAQDPAMTARVLQLANSAAYGMPTEDADPVAAVRELGIENIKALLLLSHTYSTFAKQEAAGFSVAKLWKHSHATSQLASAIAREAGAGAETITQSATAGLLHNVGKLALAANLPGQIKQVCELASSGTTTWWAAEQKVFGATHGEVGGWLLGVWGLPVPIVEAVALHHHPAQFLSRAFCPLTAVHVADSFLRSPDLEAATALVDAEYLRAIGVLEKLPEWWSRCHSPTP
ncbi:MAG: HDOD domain-containing protein [Pedosphaera sp.]|nr:HDOD domain-containing protein [Pedosphaera sp.]